MKTVRLTVAQALIKFLDNQYIEFDGKVTKFVEGIFGIFGHGNVLGIGQALEQDSGNLIKGVMNKVWPMWPLVLQSKIYVKKFMLVPLLLGLVRPI